MFEALTQWQWVAVAWAHLILSYIGYLLYLRWRRDQASRLAEQAEVRSSRS